MQKFYCAVVAVSSALILSACGGGSSGSGSDDTFSITANNASMTVYLTQTVMTGLQELVFVLDPEQVESAINENGQGFVTYGNFGSGEVPGVCDSGRLGLTIADNDSSGDVSVGDVIELDADNCDSSDAEAVIDGELVLRELAPTATHLRRWTIDTDLEISATDDDAGFVIADGVLTVDYAQPSGADYYQVSTQEMELVAGNADEGTVIDVALNNVLAELTLNIDNTYNQSYMVDVAGVVQGNSLAISGVVDTDHSGDYAIADGTFDALSLDFPTGGVLSVTAAQNTHVLATSNGSLLTLDVDIDGDGLVDDSQMTSWGQLEDDAAF